MKIQKNKISAITIALLLMLTIATSMTVMPARAIDIPTFLKLNANPNPAGVGQTVYFNAFTTNPPLTGGSNMKGDRWENMTIEVTQPDGTKQTLGPFSSDATGGIVVSYVPTTTGNYSLQAFFSGQTLTGQNPRYPGITDNPGGLIGSYMQPSQSDKIKLVVKEEPASNVYQTPPLPTEYWSRPIYATNYAWATLGGSWFGAAAPGGTFAGGYDATGVTQPYSTAPNTAHIVWTKPISFGGQVGEPINGDQNSAYYGVTRGVSQWEPIIISGILYYTNYPNYNVKSSMNAVDLRTGETLWTQPFPTGSNEQLRMGQVLSQFTSQGYYGSAAYLYAKIGTTLKVYEPFTGMYLANITDVPTMSYETAFMMDFASDDNQGTILVHYTDGGYLRMWNSTQAMAYPAGNKTVDIGMISYSTPSVNWSAGLGKPGGWSVLLPTTFEGNPISLSVAARTNEVILMQYMPGIGTPRAVDYINSKGWQIVAGYDAKTGVKLWGPLNQTLQYGQVTNVLCARDGVYVASNKDTSETYGYSLTTGKLLWGPVKLPSNAWSPLMHGGDIAYGNVYIWDFGGYVTALDLQTGQIKWTHTPRNAGLDTPYGIYPIWAYMVSIADGKIFLPESHLYTTPLFPGAHRFVLNATTGEEVWSISSFAGKSFGAIADGMMVQVDAYDHQIDCFGKGPTATTVSIQNDVTTLGNKVLMKGMVTDESTGTKNSDRIARFPNGVPAVSDASMSQWMEYVYMQQPKPTNATGVDVTLSVLDSNGNYRDIGTTTADADGFFSFDWMPDIVGHYTVYASFVGSESYWPSHAVTAFNVDPAAPTPAPTEAPAQSTADMYFVPAVGGIIAAIAVCFAITILVLRKRP